MANSCSSPLMSLNSTYKPGYTVWRSSWFSDGRHYSKRSSSDVIRVKAAGSKSIQEKNSIHYTDCGGNGLINHGDTVRKLNWFSNGCHNSKRSYLENIRVKAADNKSTQPKISILCTDCEGNGAKKCPQCTGTGINSVDHFNGQFKAGALCWLCRGKKEVLCGNCNGAGFLGGFMSTFDE